MYARLVCTCICTCFKFFWQFYFISHILHNYINNYIGKEILLALRVSETHFVLEECIGPLYMYMYKCTNPQCRIMPLHS